MNEELRFYPSDEYGMPFTVILAGTSPCDKNYYIHRNVSTVTVMEYIVSGTGVVTCNSESKSMSADTIYLLPQGSFQEYRSLSDEPWYKIYLNIRGEFAVDLIDKFGLSQEYFFDGSGLRPLFERIPEIIRAKTPNEEKQAAFAGLYVEILARLKASCSASEHSSDALLLKRYLDKNIKRIVSNRELADKIYRSMDYTVKLFRREFSQTPYDYQLSLKISTANHLLICTALSIGEIAQLVGYHDQHYFSNIFKQKCGCCPKDYRKKYLHR